MLRLQNIVCRFVNVSKVKEHYGQICVLKYIWGGIEMSEILFASLFFWSPEKKLQNFIGFITSQPHCESPNLEVVSAFT